MKNVPVPVSLSHHVKVFEKMFSIFPIKIVHAILDKKLGPALPNTLWNDSSKATWEREQRQELTLSSMHIYHH